MRIPNLATSPLMRVACVCILLHASFLAAFAAPQESAAPQSLSITILEGDNAIVNVRQRVSREAIVQVDDENHKPVAGAIVTFFTPNDGPSATFMNGSHTITATTDAQGRVAMRGITPNKAAGKFEIRVTATKEGKSASTTITQTNMVGAATAAAGGISGKTLAILLGVGGAAAVGIAVGLAGGKSSTTTPTSTPTATSVTLQPGTPTVGPPH